MLRIIIILVASMSSVLINTSVFAASALGSATVEIAKEITIVEDNMMDFGRIYVDVNAGTVDMDASGVITSSYSTGSTTQPGEFTVTALPLTPLTISFSTTTMTGGGGTISLSNFVYSTTPASNTTDASGTLKIFVGGRLTLNANQAPGTYVGNYTITVVH